MADPLCSSFHIPGRLHRCGKSSIPDFGKREILYRRYDPKRASVKLPFPEDVISTAISFDRGMSVNRSTLCSSPADVLFEVKSGQHYAGHAILVLEIARLQVWSFSTNDGSNVYTVQVGHTPTQCMYPHSDVTLLLNGIAVNDVSPKTLKTEIKRALAAAAALVVIINQAVPTS
jgi:hypothetical protein